VKMDWCNTDGMKPADTYPLMSKAMNKTGRNMHLNMCEWGLDKPWTWGPEVAQSWRMAGDHTGNWASTKKVIQQSAKIPAENTGKPYGWNDMDMLETGNYEQAAHANGKMSNMSPTEYRTEFSMWAISASPLVVTTPLMNCSAADGKVFRNGGQGARGLKHPSMADAGGCHVVKSEQLSTSPCLPGVSYGCFDTNQSMWTSLGCRAYFVLDGGDRSILCDNEGYGRHVCDPEDEPVPEVKCSAWMSDLQKEILLNQEIIAINQDVTPQGRPVKDGDLSVWARHLSDGSVAVALYNADDKDQDMSVSFESLGWDKTQQAAVRDLWQHKDMGVATGRYPAKTVTVEAHGTVMLRLTKQTEVVV